MSRTKRITMRVLLAFMLLFSLATVNKVSAYETVGDQESPTLTINKFQQEPGTADGLPGDGTNDQVAQGNPVEGVEFTLTLQETFNPATNEWEDAPGGTTLVGVTDANGTLTFDSSDGLVLGRYSVDETSGPENIILNINTYEVDVPMTNEEGTVLNYDVVIYPKNEIIREDVELTKMGQDGQALKGIVFNLKRVKTADETEDTLVATLTTDDFGKINYANLEAGYYYFQEVSSITGVVLNNTEIFFRVAKVNEDGEYDVLGQRIAILWDQVEGFAKLDEEGNLMVINYDIPTIDKEVVEDGNIDRDKEFTYTITIRTPKDLREYATFVVTDTLDDKLTFISDETDELGVDFVQNGQVLIWEFDTDQALVDTDVTLTFKAKINKDAEFSMINNEAMLEFDNGRGGYGTPKDDIDVYPTEGGFTVKKIEKGNEEKTLQGAEFKLTDADGNIINAAGTVIKVNGILHNGLLENLVTRADGTFEVIGLTPGTYYLHETKAPTHVVGGETRSYRLLTKAIKITVLDDVDAEVIVENSKAGWVLPATGGGGPILFTIVGLSMMGMGTGLFTYSRRRSDSKE